MSDVLGNMGRGDTLLNAVIGAAVTVALSFTGFSPLLGGGVAGYLQRESRKSGAKVGALSGAFAVIPFLLFGSLFFGAFLAAPMLGMMGGGFGVPGSVELLLVLAFVLPLLILWNVGLAAVGGYLGAYVREESESRDGGATAQ